MHHTRRPIVTEPTFAELFTPKLVTVLREGYDLTKLRADCVAGLTVAIVALPLSMAIAIGSGAPPDRGLYAAIIGGFLVSALGGSRFQIGGPAGAFIVLVSAIIQRHGFEGFLLATILAGLIMIAIGFLRLGTYIKYIPHPVTVGFTSGIAVIIFASQLKDLFGLTLPGPEPGELIYKVQTLAGSFETVNSTAVLVSAATIGIILALRRWRPAWPGMLIAVAAGAAAAAILDLPVETVGSRFGGIPSTLPLPAFPSVTVERVLAVLPDAVMIALLGSIESLLSAVVADGMTGRRHRSNCELVAQGVANIGSALFGGICVTGTIARTATNVRSGAIGPVAGMLHSLFVLAFMIFAAPLAGYIPLATLAGVLATVAWNMAERHAFVEILTRSRGEAIVLLATFLLTVFRDLAAGITVGVVLGSLLFMHRMAEIVSVESGTPFLQGDEADVVDSGKQAYSGVESSDRDVMVYRLSGPLFFGASTTVASVLERIGRYPKTIILDLSAVPLADSTAASALKSFAAEAHHNGARLVIAAASPAVRHALVRDGLRPPLVDYAAKVSDAVTDERESTAGQRE